MKHFGRLLVVIGLLGLLSGCGSVPKGGAGDDASNAENGMGEKDGQGIDRLGSSASYLDDPHWPDGKSPYGTFDVNVEPEHRIRFELNSALISQESARVLAHNAAWIRKNIQKTIITVEGHCDERGTREFNLALGQQRADAVSKFLSAQGVNAARIYTVSYGKERPLVVGHDESAWKENRRSEIVFH